MEQTISTANIEIHTYSPDYEVFLQLDGIGRGGYKIQGTCEYVCFMIHLILQSSSHIKKICYTGEISEGANLLIREINESLFDK